MTARRDPQKLLDAIAQEIRDHVPCGFAICEQANNLVPGEGGASATVMLVGEAPGPSGCPQIRSISSLLQSPRSYGFASIAAPRLRSKSATANGNGMSWLVPSLLLRWESEEVKSPPHLARGFANSIV